MFIEVNDRPDSVELRTLADGEIFKLDGSYYIKTVIQPDRKIDGCLGVNLINGMYRHLPKTTPVEHMSNAILVTDGLKLGVKK